MRPFRFLLLLIFFVAVPIGLTCWSLLVTENPPDFNAGYSGGPRPSRLQALFSFSTPSSLFPPSAVISLTNDNSTFFLARPAAFGPSLPSRGLSGRLWVGRGFGDDALLKEENLHIAGWELGCSDVPGWAGERAKSITNIPPVDQDEKTAKVPRDLDNDRARHDTSETDVTLPNDGTDDYLHHPLPDSNPATPGQAGEPASADADKNKKPTHADIESLQESAAIAGKIVMLSRGGCGFLEKVKWAQRRGGIALIVGDNEKGAQLTIMYAKGDTSNVTIPALFTSYTSAHLLSSLVPPEEKDEETSLKAAKGNPGKSTDQKQDNNEPVFTSTKAGATQATTLPDEDEKGWVRNVLSAVGLNDNSPFSQHEDSRRPPSSGNVEWVLVEDWKEEARTDQQEETNTLSSIATLSTSSLKPKSTSSKRLGGDDFVIGVQDWRDADLVAPKPAPVSSTMHGKSGKHAAETASSVKSSSDPEATLKGGSITPGSGEYDHEKPEPLNRFHRGNAPSDQKYGHDTDRQSRERASWLDVFRSGRSRKDAERTSSAQQNSEGEKVTSAKSAVSAEENEQPGLWVTLTPTSVSTSPFFDTLLVLVVSPLVTLTVVYALLLLRSRIRRRRWRAPKSVVDRLPVRTYHTMTTASSTTSSQVASPEHSSPTSPLLISTSQSVSQRPRPRSQTAAASFAGGTSVESQLSQPRSLPTEKPASPPTPKPSKRKRYTGRQIECVVCLEEYVDGESQVMSLPCGHEFHVDCITPWLVTRRRTCPICKGDVVRSLARQRTPQPNEDDDEVDDDEEEAGVRQGESTSDDVQNRVAQTVNDEPSAAIPIPSFNRDDEDIERGRDPDVPLLDGDESLESSSTITATTGSAMDASTPSRRGRDGERQSLWRNIVSASVNRLSGDTLWRQPPVDRNR